MEKINTVTALDIFKKETGLKFVFHIILRINKKMRIDYIRNTLNLKLDIEEAKRWNLSKIDKVVFDYFKGTPQLDEYKDINFEKNARDYFYLNIIRRDYDFLEMLDA